MVSASPFDEEFVPAPPSPGGRPVPFDLRLDQSRIQAAHLLDLGSQLLDGPRGVASAQERALLGIPNIDSAPRRGRLTQDDFDEAVPQSMRGSIGTDAPPPEVATLLWEASARTASAAAALLNVQMQAEADVVAIAAAAAIHVATRGTSLPAIDRLERSLQSSDAISRRLALTVLRVELRTPETLPRSPSPESRDETSVCIHGTWAGLTDSPWYASGSPLHTHIREDCAPNVFDGLDHFRWTGGFSEQDRIDGARDFPAWKAWQGVGQIDTIFAHSHGGNVALWRLEHGERIRQLVLLHTPVTRRRRHQWEQIGANVESVLVFHTWADLVMWGDKLRNRSMTRPSRILPHQRIPLSPLARTSWFSHDYFLDPQHWRTHDLAGRIRYEREVRTNLP